MTLNKVSLIFRLPNYRPSMLEHSLACFSRKPLTRPFPNETTSSAALPPPSFPVAFGFLCILSRSPKPKPPTLSLGRALVIFSRGGRCPEGYHRKFIWPSLEKIDYPFRAQGHSLSRRHKSMHLNRNHQHPHSR